MASTSVVKTSLIELRAFRAISDSGYYKGLFGELHVVIRCMQVA